MKLGYVDVDVMLQEISWTKFQEWWAFAKIEGPFGEWRSDVRSAQIVAAISNLFRRDPIPIADFILSFEDQTHRRQTWEEQKQIEIMIAFA